MRRQLDTVRSTVVVLLGFSGGLMSLYAGGGLVVVAGATGLGFVFGLSLVWLALPSSRDQENPRLQWED